MVRAGLEVLEIQRGLDLDDRMQYEGRVLALRFAKFWVLGLYVPHKESEYDHLLEQITSWTARTNMPVVMGGDMNSVLDSSLTQGIRVHTPGFHNEIPSDYFDGSFPPRVPLFGEPRRLQF